MINFRIVISQSVKCAIYWKNIFLLSLPGLFSNLLLKLTLVNDSQDDSNVQNSYDPSYFREACCDGFGVKEISIGVVAEIKMDCEVVCVLNSTAVVGSAVILMMVFKFNLMLVQY